MLLPEELRIGTVPDERSLRQRSSGLWDRPSDNEWLVARQCVILSSNETFPREAEFDLNINSTGNVRLNDQNSCIKTNDQRIACPLDSQIQSVRLYD